MVVWSGDRSQAPTKATGHSTARTCHTRTVLPAAAAAAAGRQGCSFVLSSALACSPHATAVVFYCLGCARLT